VYAARPDFHTIRQVERRLEICQHLTKGLGPHIEATVECHFSVFKPSTAPVASITRPKRTQSSSVRTDFFPAKLSKEKKTC
jgi:hypothetical protein